MYGLHFPLLVTSAHFALKSVLARFAMYLSGLPAIRLGPAVLLTGLATAADVALSNQAFLYLAVTTYTIVKSSVPVWILIFSVALGLRRPTLPLLLVLLAIVVGVSLVAMDGDENVVSPYPSMVHGQGKARASAARDDAERAARPHGPSEWSSGEDVAPPTPPMTPVPPAAPLPPLPPLPPLSPLHSPQVEAFGIVLVLSASLCAGFRWACAQMLLSGFGGATARPQPPEQPDSGGADEGVGRCRPSTATAGGTIAPTAAAEAEVAALHSERSVGASNDGGPLSPRILGPWEAPRTPPGSPPRTPPRTRSPRSRSPGRSPPDSPPTPMARALHAGGRLADDPADAKTAPPTLHAYQLVYGTSLCGNLLLLPISCLVHAALVEV